MKQIDSRASSLFDSQYFQKIIYTFMIHDNRARLISTLHCRRVGQTSLEQADHVPGEKGKRSKPWKTHMYTGKRVHHLLPGAHLPSTAATHLISNRSSLKQRSMRIHRSGLLLRPMKNICQEKQFRVQHVRQALSNKRTPGEEQPGPPALLCCLSFATLHHMSRATSKGTQN